MMTGISYVVLLGAFMVCHSQLPPRLQERSLIETVRRLVKLKVQLDADGRAQEAGLTLAGCLRDPPLARFLYNHFSGVDACEYCMSTVGKCSRRGDKITPIYIDDVTLYRGYRLVITNSIPSHDYRANNTCEYYKAMLLPLYTRVPKDEEDRNFRVQPPGTVGIASTGGLIVNDLTREGKCGILSTIEEDETQRGVVDACDGHSIITDCQYHYHRLPSCAVPFGIGTACRRVGFMHDGVSIYSGCTVRLATGEVIRMKSCLRRKTRDTYGCYADDWRYEKEGLCNLDRANGYLFEEDGESLDGVVSFFKGVYYYFMTPEFPYTPIYYAGENPGYTSQEALCGISPTNFRYKQPNEFYQRLCIRGKAYGPDQPIYVINTPTQIPPRVKPATGSGKPKPGKPVPQPDGANQILVGGSSSNIASGKNTPDIVKRILISEGAG